MEDRAVNEISRRRFLKFAGIGAMGLVGSSMLPEFRWVIELGAGNTKPNFVFFLIDDLGWRDVGCYGSTFYETPNIDKLASQGMRFTNAYAACPVCSPTRASILAGKYPARLNLTDWIPGHGRKNPKLIVPKFSQQLPLKEETIAEALKSAGYVSASIGKWHLGEELYYPEKQGFDLNIGGTHKGQPPAYFAPYQIPTLKEGKEGEYLTDRLTDEALAFIEKNKDRPFFLYLPHFAVHTPIQGKEEKADKYKNKVKPGQEQNNAMYAAMIESVDESVGRVLKKLELLGIAGRTVIIFMSDNGGLTRMTSNAPLRAGKGTLYEGGIREPMIIKWPGVTKPGKTCDVPVTSTDFYPTMLEMAGQPLKPEQHQDGLSMVPLLKESGTIKRDALYWHYPHYHFTTPAGAVRQGDWKLIEYYEDGRLELYNLKEDISETTNLVEKMSEKALELKKMLANWRKSVDAKMPAPNPDYKQ
ncbi:MAG: sulfatase [Candidatus Aminicenantes bacterium]|nr:sulfatase [Candidatus Aminicenantes bacterium]